MKLAGMRTWRVRFRVSAAAGVWTATSNRSPLSCPTNASASQPPPSSTTGRLTVTERGSLSPRNTALKNSMNMTGMTSM